jgi:hypothetical protein
MPDSTSKLLKSRFDSRLFCHTPQNATAEAGCGRENARPTPTSLHKTPQNATPTEESFRRRFFCHNFAHTIAVEETSKKRNYGKEKEPTNTTRSQDGASG